MSDPVPARISRPRLLQVLARPRLFRALDRARKCPVVWIAAPPGAGKTTLVSHYLEQRKLENLWYRVPQLLCECLPDLDAGIVVLDDYHELAAQAALHQALGEWIAQIPPGANLFVLSRDDPPAALARAQVNGLIVRLDWDALKATPQEARRLAELKARRRLESSAHEQLYALCQGWIAGLLLQLEPAPQVLFDYFGSQVFDRMEAGAREILVQSAFLPKMTHEAVQRLTGVAHAGRLVEDLHRRNYFIVGHGKDPAVYEYNPLFRKFLLDRARVRFAPDCLREIERRAATLLSESGQFEEAVTLFRDIGDEPGLAGIVMRHAPELMKQGRTETILDWLHALSDESVQRSPWLLYWLGVCTMTSDPVSSRASLERALQLFDAEPNPAGVYLSWCAIVNRIVHGWDDYHPLDRWIGLFEELRARHGDFPSLEIETEVVGSMFAALQFRQPNHPRIGFWEQRLHALLSSAPDPAQAARLGIHLLNYYLWFGYFSKARLLVETLAAYARNAATPAELLPCWGAMEAAYYWSIGEPDASSRVFEETSEAAKKRGGRVLAGKILTQQVHVHLARGDFEAAAKTLKEVREYVGAHRFELAHYHFLASMTALFQEDLMTAREHIQVALKLTQESGAAFPRLAGHFGAAQIAFAEGDYAQAGRHVAQGRTLMSSVTVDYFCFLFEARLAFARCDEARGRRFLRDALSLAKEHGIVHYPWWSPAMMADLYAKALDAGIEAGYVQAIIRKRKLVPHTPPVDVEAWPFPVKLYTLGRFSVLIDGKPLRFNGKAQRKPLELLMALVAFGGRDVGEAQLTEALWPDAEGDAAHDACAAALHRLRRLLGHDRAIVLRGTRLSLDPRYVWVDVWAFERALGWTQNPCAAAVGRASEKVAALYQGPFLGTHVDLGWSLPARERLRSRFLRHIVERGRGLFEAGEFESAVIVLEKGLDVDPLAEDLYRNLMRCYQAVARRAEAIGVYQRCQKTLAATLGISPAPETVALYHRLHSQAAIGS